MSNPIPIRQRDDGTVLGELDEVLYVGTPTQITHADLTPTTTTDADGRTVQEWGYEGECFIRQTVEADAVLLDELPVTFTKGIVDGELADVPITFTVLTWEVL